MNKKTIIILSVAAILLMSLSFYGGILIGTKKSNTTKNTYSNQFNPQNSGLMGFGSPSAENTRTTGRINGFSGGASGEVISKDENSITLKLRDGGSKIVLYSGKTIVSKMASSTIADILVGNQAVVTGVANSDGSISAESIQLR